MEYFLSFLYILCASYAVLGGQQKKALFSFFLMGITQALIFANLQLFYLPMVQVAFAGQLALMIFFMCLFLHQNKSFQKKKQRKLIFFMSLRNNLWRMLLLCFFLLGLFLILWDDHLDYFLHTFAFFNGHDELSKIIPVEGFIPLLFQKYTIPFYLVMIFCLALIFVAINFMQEVWDSKRSDKNVKEESMIEKSKQK